MDKTPSGTKIAERMLTQPQGATMREIIAATGGPQYNVLRRLKSKGCAVRETREGRETRYYVAASREVYEMSVNDKGQVTLPKGLRDELRFYAGQTLDAVIEGGKVVLSPRTNSIQNMFGMLGAPPNGRHASVADMHDAIKQRAVARHLRAAEGRK